MRSSIKKGRLLGRPEYYLKHYSASRYLMFVRVFVNRRRAYRFAVENPLSWTINAFLFHWGCLLEFAKLCPIEYPYSIRVSYLKMSFLTIGSLIPLWSLIVFQSICPRARLFHWGLIFDSQEYIMKNQQNTIIL